MANKRTSDSGPIAFFRSDRIISEGGKWFFFTREGTIEGPFNDKVLCLNQLEMYIKVMQSGMLSQEYDETLRECYQQAV
jgi:hypothetical protein